jgi:capsular polysaccharide biosynthesis protein
MDKVVNEHPNLGLNANQLINRVNVNSTNESQLMTISVEDYSYARAVQIVNTTAEVFRNQIPLLMKIDNVTVLNEANAAIIPAPINLNPKMNIVISIVISFILAVGFVFILEYMDDTVKTEEEIKKYFGLPTLGMISKVKKKDLKSSASVKLQKQAGDPLYVSPNI